MKRKRVIITGSTGMLGINLVNFLLERDIEVLALVRKDSLKSVLLPKNKKLKILECDLSELDSIEADNIGEYDILYHLGWEGTVGDSRNDMYLQNKNVKNTLDSINLAHRCKCKVFIGAGSQAEYGNKMEKLSTVTSTDPITGYGIAKLCAGKMAKILCENYSIRCNWCRILSVYGPHDGNATLIHSLIEKMSKKLPISCTEGKQVWDYLYVKDAVEALYLVSEEGVDGKSYVIGSGHSKILRSYIETIKSLIDPNYIIGYGEIPYSKNQLMYLCADIDELTKDTGFVPTTNFETGIKEMIKWYMEKNNEKN